jgi:capsular exopolysaccharide synthesis family protein
MGTTAEHAANLASLPPAIIRTRTRAARVPSRTAALSPELFAVHDPRGSRTEALRGLRAELLLRWLHANPILAVLGPRRRDGSDIVAANLAIGLAQLGEQTLLIDADMRRPSLDGLFGLDARLGLADVLKNCDLCDDALQPIGSVPNLHVLAAGNEQDSPQELISRTAFIYLMKTLPDSFSAVIIAAPPALDYADAQIVAARAGGCLLVTRRHRTRMADIARIRTRLEPTGATLVGGVVRE